MDIKNYLATSISPSYNQPCAAYWGAGAGIAIPSLAWYCSFTPPCWHRGSR